MGAYQVNGGLLSRLQARRRKLGLVQGILSSGHQKDGKQVCREGDELPLVLCMSWQNMGCCLGGPRSCSDTEKDCIARMVLRVRHPLHAEMPDTGNDVNLLQGRVMPRKWCCPMHEADGEHSRAT